jgi:hypothetical protein
LARNSGLAAAIDRRLHLLKVHRPYHESDHVLNIAYNLLAGGTCLEDLETLRQEEGFLDALGAKFKTFLAALMRVPCQIVTTGRRIVYRLLAWNPWQAVFLRLAETVRRPLLR